MGGRGMALCESPVREQHNQVQQVSTWPVYRHVPNARRTGLRKMTLTPPITYHRRRDWRCQIGFLPTQICRTTRFVQTEPRIANRHQALVCWARMSIIAAEV